MNITPIGTNKVRSSSLWNPRGVRKPKKFTRSQQVLIVADSVKGHKTVKVTGIHSIDGGRTHIGLVGAMQVGRVSMVNGMQDKQGRTVGMWQEVREAS